MYAEKIFNKSDLSHEIIHHRRCVNQVHNYSLVES